MIGGLKLTPSQPTFTQARDGILVGRRRAEPGRPAAIVKRRSPSAGMGKNAVSPPSTSTNLAGVVEDFTVP